MITVGSLFSGIGGIDLGLERAGMECAWQVEIDDYATKVLEKHWPNVRRWKDVSTFPPRPIQKWKCDIITGGFPCQDISYAGKGAGLDGERSGLWWEFVRVIRTLEPTFVLVENVGALLTRGIDTVLGTLASIGYDAEWHCIPAAAVGAPHIRDRVFIIAYTKYDGCSRQSQFSQSESNSEQHRLTGTCQIESDAQQLPVYSQMVRCFRFGNRHSSENWWAIEPDMGRVAHGVPSRVDRLRCLGNAVVPQVAEWIGRQIVEFDRNNK